jgi:L-lactate utilization protein LutB
MDESVLTQFKQKYESLATYVTLMAGRSPLGKGVGPRQSHLIILDNGRTRMRKDPLFQDALDCIRCAACMNIGPTYGIVGGHTFGYICPGPIGAECCLIFPSLRWPGGWHAAGPRRFATRDGNMLRYGRDVWTEGRSSGL